MNPVLGFSDVESIPMLNGSNFWEWKEHLLLVLALMDLDIWLREERPDATDKIEQWDRSNRMSMMIMRFRIPEKFKGVVPEDVTTAKEYLAAVEKCFTKSYTTEVSMVLAEFSTSMRKKATENVREYIMTKMSMAAKMKKLGFHIPDSVVADMLLDSLPSEYDTLKRTYSFLQKKWSTHELIYHCVQEEESMERKKKEPDLAAGKKRKNYDSRVA